MLRIERQRQIMNYLNEHKKAGTEELAELFNVSSVTIRRDIDILSKQGLLFKTHGGAVTSVTVFNDIPFFERAGINKAEKAMAGSLAASLIEDYDNVIIDTGTTTLQIAKHITAKNITVLTNDIQIAAELIPMEGVLVYISGGRIEQGTSLIHGVKTTQFFQDFHVNKAFIGCDAVDPDFGISDRFSINTDVKRTMINSADRVIVVADHTKLGKREFINICDMSRIDTLVTDSIDSETYDALIKKDIEVLFHTQPV